MLVLFDIDGTLLRTDGAGVRAFLCALHELQPHIAYSFDGVEVAGQLDTGLWNAFAALHGTRNDDESLAAFRESYGRHLSTAFRTKPARPMVGMHQLVDSLSKTDGVTVGLLTGNFEHTGFEKIRSAGFCESHFAINAFADDGSTRRHLPPVAIERCNAKRGSPIDPRNVVIIGDTPSDIDCAKHNGCRSLGVATGIFSTAQLNSAGANLSVTDCSDHEAVRRWILGSK
ncbi:MAG: haloacid dehalogenase-like hydrolase [Planctomycetota bacterium]|nr:haloacid dehalogenase-like hydrolase [Planctomycetota bacterium]